MQSGGRVCEKDLKTEYAYTMVVPYTSTNAGNINRLEELLHKGWWDKKCRTWLTVARGGTFSWSINHPHLDSASSYWRGYLVVTAVCRCQPNADDPG